MFTGLVEDIGTVSRVDRRSDAAVLTIAPAAIVPSELELGESVAIDGCCLTVTDRAASRFTVLAGCETLRLTTAGQLRPQSTVNLERALRVGDRLGGHLVSGHIDGIGEIAARRDLGANIEIDVRTPPALMRFVIDKGSIAIDGISLTVNRTTPRSFTIALIPHTVDKTTLAAKKPGARVNLEVDMIGKYVDKLVAPYGARLGGDA